MTTAADRWAAIEGLNYSGLAPNAIRVGIALIQSMDVKTGRCFPSAERLAMMLGLHINSVKRAKVVLSDAHIITWTVRDRRSFYTFNLDRLQNLSEQAKRAWSDRDSAAHKSEERVPPAVPSRVPPAVPIEEERVPPAVPSRVPKTDGLSTTSGAGRVPPAVPYHVSITKAFTTRARASGDAAATPNGATPPPASAGANDDDDLHRHHLPEPELTADELAASRAMRNELARQLRAGRPPRRPPERPTMPIVNGERKPAASPFLPPKARKTAASLLLERNAAPVLFEAWIVNATETDEENVADMLEKGDETAAWESVLSIVNANGHALQ